MKKSVQKILTCGNQVGLMKKAVDEMYDEYTSISNVTVQDQNDPSVYLPKGKAISPSQAAHCLLEMKRTAIFIRGIHEAVQQKLKQKQSVKILYAGTGPYATLVAPLFTLYRPHEIEVDLLEVNPVSLQSAIDVIKGLGFDEFVGQTYCADATTFRSEKPYDIVISETMQAALKKEPQVAIMQNLIPQLPPDAIFIPQKITVTATLVARGKWNAEKFLYENIELNELGTVMQVDRAHLHPDDYTCQLQVPHSTGHCDQMKLFTTVQVFNDHVLAEGDCSLNIPLKLMDVSGMEGETLRFWYEQGELPHICCQAASTGCLYNAMGRPERRLGLNATHKPVQS